MFLDCNYDLFLKPSILVLKPMKTHTTSQREPCDDLPTYILSCHQKAFRVYCKYYPFLKTCHGSKRPAFQVKSETKKIYHTHAHTHMLTHAHTNTSHHIIFNKFLTSNTKTLLFSANKEYTHCVRQSSQMCQWLWKACARTHIGLSVPCILLKHITMPDECFIYFNEWTQRRFKPCSRRGAFGGICLLN